jgi:hypothetical protein
VTATSAIPRAPATSRGRSETALGTVSGGTFFGSVPTTESPGLARSNHRRGRDRGDHRDEHAWNPRNPSPEHQNHDKTEYADGDGRTDSVAMSSTRTA